MGDKPPQVLTIRGCLLFGTALLLTVLAACAAGVAAVGPLLTSTDALSPADAVVILGGDNGEFARTRHATWLLQQGYAAWLVFSSSSAARLADLPCSSVQRVRETAAVQDVPADSAIVVHGVRSTYDEALELRRLAEQNNWRSLIVVTDLYHTRRAGRTFRSLLPDMTMRSPASRWRTPRSSWKAFRSTQSRND